MLDLPPRTVRLRLTLLLSGLFLLSGIVLLIAMYLIFRANSGVDLIVPHGSTPLSSPAAIRRVQRMFAYSVARNSHGLHQGLLESGIALAIMTVVSVALGWLVAGRVLRPLRTITATTRQISESNLNERLGLSGPQDELTDLADTIDELLSRLQAHVIQQERFAANASHELRTPLALTRTLLDVAREDPHHDHGELIDRLHVVNSRAIDLTEALLLLSHADRQRSLHGEPLDMSLVVEEATETLLPLAERRGVTIETTGEPSQVIGSPPLLLQLVMNLVHNAIVHNLPRGGTVWVGTRATADGTELTIENTGRPIAAHLISTLEEPFQRGGERARSDHAGVGLGLAIVTHIARAHDGTLALSPRADGGLRVMVHLGGPSGPHARAST